MNHKLLPHAFNSRVSWSTNQCINNAIHVLLMYRLGMLNMLIRGPKFYVCLSVNRSFIIIGPKRRIVTESVQPHVECEKMTKYSPIFITNFANISLIFAFKVIKYDFSIH